MRKAFIFFSLIMFVLSCTKDIIVEKDFSGNYQGVLECNGLSSINGLEIDLKILKTNDDLKYTIELDEDVIFNATQKENILTIYKQTLNKGGDVDVITFEGTFKYNDDGDLFFKFKHKVDDEPENNCSATIKKK